MALTTQWVIRGGATGCTSPYGSGIKIDIVVFANRLENAAAACGSSSSGSGSSGR